MHGQQNVKKKHALEV